MTLKSRSTGVLLWGKTKKNDTNLLSKGKVGLSSPSFIFDIIFQNSHTSTSKSTFKFLNWRHSLSISFKSIISLSENYFVAGPILKKYFLFVFDLETVIVLGMTLQLSWTEIVYIIDRYAHYT